jgi:hypothetical protein
MTGVCRLYRLTIARQNQGLLACRIALKLLVLLLQSTHT